MGTIKLWKSLRNIQEWKWGQGVEVTKTGSEAAKAVFDLAKAVKDNKPNVQNLKPYVEQISSLLDVFNSPLGQIIKEAIPFAPIAITILKLTIDITKKEPSLESCVILVSQTAYIESFQKILKQDIELFNKINQDCQASDDLARQIKKLGEQEFDEREVKKAIVYFHESKLAAAFNQILQQRLQEAGLDETTAKRLTEKVARNTHDYMLPTLVEVGGKAEKLWRWYSSGGEEKLERRLSIEDYLEKIIKPKPEENVFDEKNITFRDLYVKLQVEEINEKDNEILDAQEWVQKILNNSDPEKPKQVLFIQGESGQGKSVFCRMFADFVRQELHPSFTPIIIRLRDLRVLENNLKKTIENYLENVDFVTSDPGWSTDKNTRFLFLLDGFDELLLEGRASGGLKEFLEQVEQFQKDKLCHHQFLVTGRPLALQEIERYLSQTGSLKRVKLLPMNEEIMDEWLNKWAAKVGTQEAHKFKQFLQACPDEINDKLAREPLLLYLLARMHRENHLNVYMFADAQGIQAKIRIYNQSVKWVLEEQRQDENLRLTGLETKDLRQFMTEAALCVVQSGNEFAKVKTLELRLKESNSKAAKLIQQARQGNSSEKSNKLLNNLLTALYIKPASGDKDGSVEFIHKSFSEFLFAERLINSFIEWQQLLLIPNLSGEIDKQIYDLLGYGNLKPEIVEYLMGLLAESKEFKDQKHLCQLFQILEKFYFRWCNGEFIDAEDVNLPLIKKKQLKEQLSEQKTHLGLRQVDVYTGLNVMILLLELHRYAQRKDDLKDHISFHPCGKPDTDEFDSTRLLRIIGYSQCLDISAFRDNLELFLSGADLRFAYLRGADLSDADLSGANLSGANLIRADLIHADLICADLSGADLRDTNLRDTNLSAANLRGAELSYANLIHANLRDTKLSAANLSGADLSGADLRDADLIHANPIVANLSGANLSGANLTNAYFRGADLSSADLRDANLSAADLKSADLSTANLSGANLAAVVWNSDTKWLNAWRLHEAVGISPELAQDSAFAAAVTLSQGVTWAREGKMKEAVEAFSKAKKIDPSLKNSAEYWNSISWYASVHGHAKAVLHFCEKAVKLDPENKIYQDSRGLARVLTGNLEGALEDFQAAVDSGALDYSDDVKQRRLRWIDALKLGNNPLASEEELEELRQYEG